MLKITVGKSSTDEGRGGGGGEGGAGVTQAYAEQGGDVEEE